MSAETLIPAIEFCKIHNIEVSFISSLEENGIIELTIIGETGYIQESQLQDLERIIRLYNDLEINIEGIETVINLLNRINDLQKEIMRLRNTLRLYENEDL